MKIQPKRRSNNRWSLVMLVFLAATITTCTTENRKRAGAVGRQGREDWVVEIWSSQVCADPGDTLTIRATVTNSGSRRLATVELHNQPVLDMVITEATRTARWSEGRILTPELTHLELEPHASKTIEMQWHVESGGPRGAVVIEADFTDDPADSRGPVRAWGQVYVGGTCNFGIGY